MDVAAFLMTQKYGLSDKSEVLVLNRKNEINAKIILPKHDQVNAALEAVSAYSGTSLILYTTCYDYIKLEQLKERCKAANVWLLDVLVLESDNNEKVLRSLEGKKVYGYDSKNDKVVIVYEEGIAYTSGKKTDDFFLSVANSGDTTENLIRYAALSEEDKSDVSRSGAEQAQELFSNIYDGDLSTSDRKHIEKNFENLITKAEQTEIEQEEGFTIIGGTLRNLAESAAKHPHELLYYDKTTADILQLYIDKTGIYETLSATDLENLHRIWKGEAESRTCLLYTSDAADE